MGWFLKKKLSLTYSITFADDALWSEAFYVMKFGRASQCPEVISNEVSNPKNYWCFYGHNSEGDCETGLV